MNSDRVVGRYRLHAWLWVIGAFMALCAFSVGDARAANVQPLEIVTKNVQMNSERIWTPHDLTFRYGQSHGSGHDLQILLSTVRDPGEVDGDAPDNADA